MGISTKTKGIKNLLGVCLSFIGVYGPYVGILTLQSSINSEGGLGLVGSVVVYAVHALFVPLVPVFYSTLGSKYSLIIGYALFFLFGVCNYYPSWYTLMPGSAAMGIALLLMFVNSQTYTSEVACLYADSLGETQEDAIALFLGVFGASIKVATILGGLISSSVLFNANFDQYTNDTMNMTNASGEENAVCDNTEADYVEQNYLYYILISIFLLLAIIGITFAVTLMDNIAQDISFQSLRTFVKVQFKPLIVSLLRMSINWKMLLLFPLFVVNGASIGFISGTFQKVFVSDCLGVEWIGIATIIYSIGGVFAGIGFGRLHRYVPAFVLIYIGGVIAGGLTLFLIFWNRVPNYYAVVGYSIGWGICDGVWQSLVSGIVGSIFANEKNVAFTVYELGVALGFVTTFSSGLIFTYQVHLWIIFGLIVYACISYTVLIFLLKLMTKSDNVSYKEENKETSTELDDVPAESKYVTANRVSEENRSNTVVRH